MIGHPNDLIRQVTDKAVRDLGGNIIMVTSENFIVYKSSVGHLIEWSHERIKSVRQSEYTGLSSYLNIKRIKRRISWTWQK